MEDIGIYFEEAEQIICKVFETERECIYDRHIRWDYFNPRHYLWFILHYHYGLSNLEIARQYGRSRRKVIQYISEIKFRISNQRADKEMFENIKQLLNG